MFISRSIDWNHSDISFVLNTLKFVWELVCHSRIRPFLVRMAMSSLKQIWSQGNLAFYPSPEAILLTLYPNSLFTWIQLAPKKKANHAFSHQHRRNWETSNRINIIHSTLSTYVDHLFLYGIFFCLQMVWPRELKRITKVQLKNTNTFAKFQVIS